MVNGKFVDENLVNGTPGSLIPSSWGNAVTDEILSVIRSTNAVPAESNNAQLTDAIVSIADLRASQAVSKAMAQATENAPGVAKVATQAQTNSGVDDTTIVTPKKMAGALQGQALVAFTTAGTAPQFTLAPVPAISAYAVNQRFQVKFHSGGAGSDKMSISGLGAKSIMQYDASGNKVAAVIQGQLTDAVYDGADIVLLDQLPSVLGVTPPQFDNSNKLATTAFVQGVGLQFSSIVALTANATLTAAHAGALIIGSSSVSAVGVTLPLGSSMPAKSMIRFWNYGNAMMTLICAGSETVVTPYAGTTLSVPTGTSITLVNGYGVWYAIDMSGVGVGQTWQNVFASRVAGTTYTNSTGRPKLVSVIGINDSALRYLIVSGLNVGQFTPISSGSVTTTVSAIVPPSATYSVTAGLNVSSGWMELI
nr:hypothetical protein [Pseudomonas gingeri]